MLYTFSNRPANVGLIKMCRFIYNMAMTLFFWVGYKYIAPNYGSLSVPSINIFIMSVKYSNI